jgi:hypothetical protein
LNPLVTRVRALALALAALGFCLLPLGSGASAYAGLRTGFEVTDGDRWTTDAEARAFLAGTDKESERVAVSRIGTTRQGRPIQLVRIGAPAAPASAPAIARGNVLLLTCSQHGDEPAGREACLTVVRGLGRARDAATRGFLERTTVLVVPDANPDGRAGDTRGNTDGTDINRDHLTLASPEARAIARVIRDYRPDALFDTHEFATSEPYYDQDVLTLWPRNLNSSPRLRAEAKLLARDFLGPAARSAGYRHGVYGLWTDPRTGAVVRQVAGDGEERILRNMAGIKHVVTLLLETRDNDRATEDRDDVARAARRRVATQLTALHAVLAYMDARGPRVEALTAAARARAAAGTGPVYLSGADNEPPEPGLILYDPPCGDRRGARQYAGVRNVLDLHGVRVRQVGDGVLVPLRQEARSLIPLLLDERAPNHLTPGTPAARCT